MYYYPWATFIVGCAIVSGIQVFVYSFIGLVRSFPHIADCGSFCLTFILFLLIYITYFTLQMVLALRYFMQTLNSPDPLAQHYINSRRRAGERFTQLLIFIVV